MTQERLSDDGLLIDGSKSTIWTYTDRRVDPINPTPDMFAIEDIAHALANQCRFTGHVRKFYSVAEHSYHASFLVPEKYALWALLHDASEAYLADLARPIKKAEGLGPTYLKYEERLMESIAKAFKLSWPMPKEITVADNLMLSAEIYDLLPASFGKAWGIQERAEVNVSKPYTPDQAELAFLRRYYDLTGTSYKVSYEKGKVFGAKKVLTVATVA